MKMPTALGATRSISVEEVDRTTAIKIASWTILVITVVVFISRQIMKAFVFRRVAIDDLLILLATVFAIGLSVTTFILASEGLGDFGFLTLERADSLMKGYYASEFLYISAICFAKLSLLVIFYNIVVVQRLQRRCVLGFGIVIFVWTIASLLAVAFQCEFPRPWETMTLRCFNSRTFWIVYCIIDMSTEISIIMLSVNLVAYLKVRFSRKVAVVACFAPRVLVISAALIRLIWLYPITPHRDPQYRLWLPSIMTQVQVCLSISTACIPYMVPFFKSLEGSLRRTYSTKSRELRIEGAHERTRLSIWSRRHKKGKVLNSRDWTAVASLQYDRVPQVSPHIPTPTPMSPLTPIRLYTPPSRSPSERRLSIRIPDSDTQRKDMNDIASPQTASSFALSATCKSPHPLLSQSFVPTRKAPTPPPKTHSVYPPTVSSNYSSGAPTPSSTPRTQRFSLFPSQRSSSRSPQLSQRALTSPGIASIRELRSNAVSSTIGYSNSLRPYNRADGGANRSRASSNTQAPKFSTAPQPQSAPPTTTARNKLQKRPASVQDLTSPMGAAINNYFNSAVLSNPPPPLTPPVSSLQRHRNQQILSPSNSSRVPTPHDVLRDELFLPRDSIYLRRASRSQTMPSVHEAQDGPYIVVQSPL
ncbi:Nn.00g085030.m01.CDS01 [Neocucurbitaria sp. VM-36]